MKKVDWNSSYKPFGSQTVSGAQPKYSSGREYLAKGLELEKEQNTIKENFKKAFPVLEALLKSRMESRTPIVVLRPFQYMTSEIVHNYQQVEDRENGGWKNGEVINSAFRDVKKSLRPGTKLTLRGLDHNLQEFIFEDQNGNEVVLPYNAKNGLMTQTNIYEDVTKFMNEHTGE